MTMSTRRFTVADGHELEAASAPEGQLPVLWSALTDPPHAVVVTPSTEYPAALVARDLATMAHLAPLRHVVVAGTRDDAELIAALFTNEPVTMSNAAGTLTNAYNRPAPPTPIVVWLSLDGHSAEELSAS